MSQPAKNPFDYSKWDKIELSDDDSDLHPNIDANSWFALKHRMRVEREEKEAVEETNLKKEIATFERRIEVLKGNESQATEVQTLQEKIEKDKKRLEEMVKQRKWNWENICSTVEERTDIKPLSKGEPKKSPATQGPVAPAEEFQGYEDFVQANEEVLNQAATLFGKVNQADESLLATRNYVHEHGSVLLSKHSSSYYLLSCLNEEMAGHSERMMDFAKISQVISNIHTLADNMKRPSRDFVIPFFEKFDNPLTFKTFFAEAESFAEKVRQRAIEKKAEESQVEYTEVEMSREERIGPGGLDPLEVLESLPECMQKAFESRDVEDMKQCAMDMGHEDFSYHLQRCIDSGLWVAGPSSDGDEEEADLDEDMDQPH